MKKRVTPKNNPSQLNKFGCYPLWETSSYLTFSITLSSNNLVPSLKYSKKQNALYDLIKHLRDEKKLGYRKISYKLNSWGIKTPRDKIWQNNSVHSILKRRDQRDFRIDKIRKKIYPIKISILKIIYTLD